MLTFSVGPFCSRQGLDITLTAVEEGTSTLPNGLSFNASTYSFNGTFEEAGIFVIEVTASTTIDSAKSTFSITVVSTQEETVDPIVAQKAEGTAAASSTKAAAAGALGAAIGANLAAGTSNFQSFWTILNIFQLVIIIALLEIEYPPKVEAFFQGFEMAALSMP